jgi:hypothetical protein
MAIWNCCCFPNFSEGLDFGHYKINLDTQNNNKMHPHLSLESYLIIAPIKVLIPILSKTWLKFEEILNQVFDLILFIDPFDPLGVSRVSLIFVYISVLISLQFKNRLKLPETKSHSKKLFYLLFLTHPRIHRFQKNQNSTQYIVYTIQYNIDDVSNVSIYDKLSVFSPCSHSFSFSICVFVDGK